MAAINASLSYVRFNNEALSETSQEEREKHLIQNTEHLIKCNTFYNNFGAFYTLPVKCLDTFSCHVFFFFFTSIYIVDSY